MKKGIQFRIYITGMKTGSFTVYQTGPDTPEERKEIKKELMAEGYTYVFGPIDRNQEQWFPPHQIAMVEFLDE